MNSKSTTLRGESPTERRKKKHGRGGRAGPRLTGERKLRFMIPPLVFRDKGIQVSLIGDRGKKKIFKQRKGKGEGRKGQREP